jgi:RNA polymerase sigma-70 factor (ECF subfamily)
MAEPDSFAGLLARVRGGEARAAEELVGQFAPQLRLEVRLRLRDPRLRRLLDEEDVCQSVLRSFFVRARLGQYDLADPGGLARLLAGMARNKLAAQARRQAAAPRDYRRAEGLAAAAEAAGGGASPSEVVAGEELLREFRARLSDEERCIADLRAAGEGWAAVAARLGGTADGRRVQLGRALARVGRELGLEEGDE